MPRPTDEEALASTKLAVEQHLSRLEKRLESITYNMGDERPIELTEELMQYAHSSFGMLQMQFMKIIAEATRND